jgi:Ser/Thr protein kinase RdoA (MazF antagonist)
MEGEEIKQLRDLLREHYGIGSKDIERRSRQTEDSHLYLVEDASGQQFVVKTAPVSVLQGWCNDGAQVGCIEGALGNPPPLRDSHSVFHQRLELLCELALTLDQITVHQSEIALSVQAPVRSLGGLPYFTAENHVFVVYPFLEGAEYCHSDDNVQLVATNLAHLHEALGGVTAERPAVASLLAVSPEYDLLSPEEEKAAESFLVEHLSSELRYNLGASLAMARQQLPQLASLESQLIHRDLHPKNIVITSNPAQKSAAGSRSGVAFIDFDTMAYAERLREVAFSAFRLAELAENGAHVSTGKLVELYASAYSAVRPISDAERMLLPTLYQDECLRRISFIVRQHLICGHSEWIFDLAKHSRRLLSLAVLQNLSR